MNDLQIVTVFDGCERVMLPPTKSVCTYEKIYNVPESVDKTEVKLEIQSREMILGFEEIELLMTYYSNMLYTMDVNITQEIKRQKIEAERRKAQTRRGMKILEMALFNQIVKSEKEEILNVFLDQPVENENKK